MCDSPIAIKNLNQFKESSIRSNLSEKMPWKDYTSDFIYVPCGHCESCIRQKQDAIVQRINFESQKNHLFMVTLTYAPEVLPKEEIKGKKYAYADTRDVKCMLKMLKKDNAFGIPFRYLGVSEFGSEKGRPHFHLLLLFPKSYFPEDKESYIQACDAFASKQQHYFTCLNYWRRNVGSRRNPVYKPLTRYKEVWSNGKIRKNYDFHYVNPFLTKNGVEDCGMYCIKYMFKPSTYKDSLFARLKYAFKDDPDKKAFRKAWEKLRPRYFASLGFGYNAKCDVNKHSYIKDQSIVDKIIDSIRVSKEAFEYPALFHEFSGRQLLVSPYYLNNTDIYSYDDRLFFWNKKAARTHALPGQTNVSDIVTYSTFKQKEFHFNKVEDHCEDIGNDCDFELLDD